MRHRVAHRKLGRVTEHRIALLRNQATALLRHERIETTVPKAKELRPFVEHLITTAKHGVAAEAEPAKSLHYRRMVMRDVADRDVVAKLFDAIAPRFASRNGGYTRLLRIGYRRGDSAEVAQVELVGSEYNPKAEAEAAAAAAAEGGAPKKPTTVGGRIRAAANRLRGKTADAGAEASADVPAKAKKAKGVKPTAKKTKKKDTE